MKCVFYFLLILGSSTIFPSTFQKLTSSPESPPAEFLSGAQFERMYKEVTGQPFIHHKPTDGTLHPYIEDNQLFLPQPALEGLLRASPAVQKLAIDHIQEWTKISRPAPLHPARIRKAYRCLIIGIILLCFSPMFWVTGSIGTGVVSTALLYEIARHYPEGFPVTLSVLGSMGLSTVGGCLIGGTVALIGIALILASCRLEWTPGVPANPLARTDERMSKKREYTPALFREYLETLRDVNRNERIQAYAQMYAAFHTKKNSPAPHEEALILPN